MTMTVMLWTTAKTACSVAASIGIVSKHEKPLLPFYIMYAEKKEGLGQLHRLFILNQLHISIIASIGFGDKEGYSSTPSLMFVTQALPYGSWSPALAALTWLPLISRKIRLPLYRVKFSLSP